jgi:hypothetical protein
MSCESATMQSEVAHCKLQIANCKSAMGHRSIPQLAICFVLFLATAPTHLCAAIDAEQAVSSGAEALDSWWDYPWYDDRNDGVRRIDVRAENQPSAPTSTPTTRGTSWNFDWLGWTLLALVAVGIAFMLFRVYWNRSRETGGSSQAGLVGSAATVDRLEDLPFPLEQPDGDLFSAARRAAEKGDYDRAIVLLYSHQLLELDRQEAIRLTKGKTNRQYLRELRLRPDLARLLTTSMIAFEDVFFGAHPLARERFEACWEDAIQLLAASQLREAA